MPSESCTTTSLVTTTVMQMSKVSLEKGYSRQKWCDIPRPSKYANCKVDVTKCVNSGGQGVRFPEWGYLYSLKPSMAAFSEMKRTKRNSDRFVALQLGRGIPTNR